MKSRTCVRQVAGLIRAVKFAKLMSLEGELFVVNGAKGEPSGANGESAEVI